MERSAGNVAKKRVRYCLSMIMKNEAHVIERCLNGIGHELDAVAVVDTGSSDESIALVNKWMKEHRVPGLVISRPWLEFDVSRTEALRHAEDVAWRTSRGELGYGVELVPPILPMTDPLQGPPKGPLLLGEFIRMQKKGAYTGSTFLLDRLERYREADLGNDQWYLKFMDADNTLMNDKNPGKLFRVPKDQLRTDNVTIDMRMGTHVYSYTWMVRMDGRDGERKRWHWVYPRHEYVTCEGWDGPTRSHLSGGYIISGREGGRSKDPLRYLKDAVIFEEYLKTHPNDSRALYYAGQSYRDAGPEWYPKAIELYLKRTKVGGFNEEIYISYLRIHEMLIHDNGEGWEEKERRRNKAFIYLLRAYNTLPNRFEALQRIVYFHRLLETPRAGWNFAQPHIHLPKATGIILLDESAQYAFYHDAAICAFQVGDKASCKALMTKITEAPNLTPGMYDSAKQYISMCR